MLTSLGVNPRLSEEVGEPAGARAIGGTADYLVTSARVDFVDKEADTTLSYDVDLHVAASSQAAVNRPSLLGRNVLDQHLMIYDPRSSRLELYR